MAFRGTVVAGVLLALPSAALAATTEIGPADDLQQAVDALGEGFKDTPPPSMGVGGSGGHDTGGASSSPSSSSAGGSTASGVQGGDPSADDGCSCHLPGACVPERSAVWMALLTAIAALRRKRR